MQQRNRKNPDLIDTEDFLCLKCLMESRSDFNPFIYLSDNQITNMNSVDSMKLFNMLPGENVIADALKTNCLNINDNDTKADELNEDLIDHINCKYFTCYEFFNHDTTNYINIIHSNVNGFLCHADNINEFINHSTNTVFDAICLTETSLKSDVAIPDSALPEGYSPYSTGTLSAKGGATIFVKNTHSITEREDLNIQTKEYESIWVEINNKKKNIVIGCVYRHPHYKNLPDFSEYMSNAFSKLNKEKKEVYITGDFNLDLLQYETNNKCRDFYNLITSFGFLPLITQPTRFCNTSQTLIDNIFTNTFNRECDSGNILIEFADHLTQFVSITKDINYTKNIPVYKLDQSKFDQQKFLQDLSTQTFIQTEDPNHAFSELLWKYESCVRRHNAS